MGFGQFTVIKRKGELINYDSMLHNASKYVHMIYQFPNSLLDFVIVYLPKPEFENIHIHIYH